VGSGVKRFWTSVAVATEGEGWGIWLDQRPIRTPARALLVVPTAPLAGGIAAEWDGVEDRVDPRAMPLTGLANAALDRVALDPQAFATTLARYAEADLACYRAEGPVALVERQAEQWDGLLTWARRRYDLDFVVTTGIVHVDQPPATVRRLAAAVAALDPFRLAGLSPLVTIGGSLVAALAVLEGGLSPETAWAAVSLDERWQLEQWGADAEAELALENRERDFLAAARFLSLLD
jgi:chaperone required for assembly of F1-ATPase